MPTFRSARVAGKGSVRSWAASSISTIDQGKLVSRTSAVLQELVTLEAAFLEIVPRELAAPPPSGMGKTTEGKLLSKRAADKKWHATKGRSMRKKRRVGE